jgi:hypothetical protein
MKGDKATPLALGVGSACFTGSFKRNLQALFRLHGDKVAFAQMKHAWAHMVQVKYRSEDGQKIDLKLHFYTEIISSEYDNVVCDECRIMGASPGDFLCGTSSLRQTFALLRDSSAHTSATI